MSKNLFLLWLCTIILSAQAYAQPFFQPSSVPETMIPGITGGPHIHDVTCDSWQSAGFPDFNSDLYISTWYDANTGLHWKRTFANTPGTVIDEGVLSPTMSAQVHDAAIIFNPIPGSAYQYGIAVVYTVGGVNGYIAFYEWTVTGPSLIFSQLLALPGTEYIRRMSIDAHRLYCYSVVIGLANGDMYSFGGWTDQATTPLVGPLKQINCPSPWGAQGYRPDIAMNHGGNIGTGLKTYYAYVKDNNHITVSWTNFDDLVNVFPFSITPTIAHEMETSSPLSNPGFESALPKIDAPEHSGDHWAVVANDVDFGTPSSSYIRTAYSVNTVPLDINLNDGFLSGTVDLTNVGTAYGIYSSIPAVAFHHDGNLLHYAWGKTIDHPDLGDHDYIGMMFDPSGGGGAGDAILGSGGEGYRIIDQNPAYNPLYRAVALTGQDEASYDMFIVFTADDLAYPPFTYMECLYAKHVDWSNIQNSGYRPGQSNENKEDCSSQTLIKKYYPNPVQDKGLRIVLNEAYKNDDLELNIYDIIGRKLYNHKGKIDELNRYLSDITTNSIKGLWTVQVMSHTSGKSESVRVSVQ